jgi:prolipoprotein diacylglyceryltransferase
MGEVWFVGWLFTMGTGAWRFVYEKTEDNSAISKTIAVLVFVALSVIAWPALLGIQWQKAKSQARENSDG